MSAQALGAAGTSGAEVGELAAAQRVQQLQALIEASRQVASPALGATSTTAASYTADASSPQGSASDFASALQAATSADAGVSPAAYQPSFQSSAASAEGGEYEGLIDQSAARNGLDPAVLHGLIQQESGFDPSATSSAGASGLTQLMPGTVSSRS